VFEPLNMAASSTAWFDCSVPGASVGDVVYVVPQLMASWISIERATITSQGTMKITLTNRKTLAVEADATTIVYLVERRGG